MSVEELPPEKAADVPVGSNDDKFTEERLKSGSSWKPQ
jgi:hypothetical protein